MNVYIISVLHTRTRADEETGIESKEIVASMPIACFSDKKKAIKTMQEFMEQEDGGTMFPIYNMYRNGQKVCCSLTEQNTDEDGNVWHTEVTLKTVEMDKESFDIDEEVCAAWN